MEQVAVALLDGGSAEPGNGVAEIEVNPVVQRPDAVPGADLLGGGTRGHVAGREVAEGGIFALQVVVAFAFRNVVGGRSSRGVTGTQMRPSLRSDSLIKMVLDCQVELIGSAVG